MPQDLLSYLGWAIWIAVMLLSIFGIEIEIYRKRKYKRIIAGESSYVGALRWLLNIGNRPEETLYCQTHGLAPGRELADSIIELITFHRPCLQYPLSNYWWRLNYCDYAAGKISALLTFPEFENTKDNLARLKTTAEIIWVFTRISKNEIEIRLDWYNLVPWKTRYKHNIFLSMVAYTDERIRRLNSTLQLPAAAPALPLTDANFHPNVQSAPAQDLLKKARTAALTIWPAPQDYNEAIQNPGNAFADGDLALSLPEENSLGIPRAVSGSFASVYHLRGKGDWAVRCFLFPITDQQSRYAILSRHLARESASSIVEFSFLENGIKVGEKTFPVLKMPWIDGLPLNIYVENNLPNRQAMIELRQSFQELVCQLRQAKIAHGDLQHGNILVRENKLFLVDYDGIFVPELRQFHSAELGHPNYQHPKRQGKHFGLFLDNFAGWLIDTSLLCLGEDPFLWDRFKGGDECLLFRRSDLIEPEKSKIFSYLSCHASRDIQAATRHFLSLLRLDLEEIPFLQAEANSLLPGIRPE